MQNTLTIATRQFRSYFNGPVAYIVVVVVMLFVGFLFWQPFFLMGRATIREMFRFMSWGLVFAAPAISMSLLAEEKRSGTLELLITMPVRESEVILGKYFASLGLLAVLLLSSVPYPLSVSMLGSLDWGPVVTGYLGLFLEGAAMMAIGIAASAWTDNQLVAFFISFAFCFFFIVVGFFLPFMPGGLATLVEWISFEYHFESISRGVVDSRDLVFFLSIAVFCVMIAFRALESRRWN